MHLVAIARAAGIRLTWDDFSELARVVPLMVRIYPNGPADINHFQPAAGWPRLSRAARRRLLHDDVQTVAGRGLEAYTRGRCSTDGELAWEAGPERSTTPAVIASGRRRPFRRRAGSRCSPATSAGP